MTSKKTLIAGCVAMAVTIGCARRQSATGEADRGEQRTARAELHDAGGNRVGNANLTEVPDGVRVVLTVSQMPTGERGVHIHESGTCDSPSFESAGAHFNPGGKEHGDLNPAGPHAGDLGNLTVAADGTGRLEAVAKGATLDGGETSLLRPGGTSIVVHAQVDDRRTNPAGDSGDRIACGVVNR
jgi:Cu-Zn family superoxide dismutase